MPLGDDARHRPGQPRRSRPAGRSASPSASELLGRVLDGLGRPIDGGPPLRRRRVRRPAAADPPRLARRGSGSTAAARSACARSTRWSPAARGQRLGIFAGSGVGKSSLLGMIARSTNADVNVICLVGERGREVREFVERDLGDGPRALGRRRRDLRRARARPHQGGVRRDDDRRVRSATRGRRRAADDGLDHALRDGAARGRPRDRRAADSARLHAVRVRACCRGCSSAPAPRDARLDHRPLHRARRGRRHERAGRRRGCARSSTATACSRASSRTATTIRRSTCSQSVSRLAGEVRRPRCRRPPARCASRSPSMRENEDLITIGAYAARHRRAHRPRDRRAARDRRLPRAAGGRALARRDLGCGAPRAHGGDVVSGLTTADQRPITA